MNRAERTAVATRGDTPHCLGDVCSKADVHALLRASGQAEQEVPVTFAEIEDVLGMPLPPSARRHPAH